MSMQSRLLRTIVCGSLSLPLVLALGCSDDGTTTAAGSATLARGNWQISSSAAAAARLSTLSGELTTQAGAISGVLHSQLSTACAAPTSAFAVSGSADNRNSVTLSGPLAGGVLTLTGTLAADGRSLTDAAYNVVGGSCAMVQKVQAVAQAFSPMQGNYAGSFADVDGRVAQVMANFSQSTTADANGNFTLAGTANIIGNPCFPGVITVSQTQVTGNTFSYSLTANGNTVNASGTFSPDAGTLTINSWNSSGSCGADTGVVSTLSRQGS